MSGRVGIVLRPRRPEPGQVQRGTRLLYAGIALFLTGLFLFLLKVEISAAAPETDLWWMLPVFRRLTEGKSFWEGLLFLLSPAPRWYELPLLKAYLWLHQAAPVLRESYGSLIVVNLLFHVANALLVYGVGRRLGLGRRAGFFSALTYLTLFIQFHAYFWPVSFQHLSAVSTVLGILFLYLRTEELFREGHPRWALYYGLTLAAGILGSLQRATMMLPVMVLAHLFSSCRHPRERAVRFNRWLPFLLFYPLYILLALCFVGDHVYNVGIFKFPLPAWVKALVLFLGWAAALALLRAGFAASWGMGSGRRRIGRILPILLVFGLAAGLILRDRREVLLPYNLITPLTTLLASFLDPIQSALSCDSTVAYHVMPSQMSFFFLLLTLFFLWVFVRLSRARPGTTALLGVWYGMCVGYLMFHRHMVSSFPLQIPSRYFVYLSPIFSWVFCFSTVALFDFLAERVRLQGFRRHVVLAGFFLWLIVPNLFAIRLELFRGRLINAYFSYDDVRSGDLIREDLSRIVSETGRPPDKVDVLGAVKMDYPPARVKYHIPIHLIGVDNSRMLIREKVHSRYPGVDLLVEEQAAGEGGRGGALYRVDGARIRDGQGRWVDPFARHFEEGLSRLDQRDGEGAAEEFRLAVERRPFLLRVLLSKCRLSDARWLTDGAGLKEWLEKIEGRWRLYSIVPVGKWEHIREVTETELREYGVCFLALSYLENRVGRPEQGHRWLSQLHFLEPNLNRLRQWLEASPQVGPRTELKRHLETLRNLRTLPDPLPWQKDDFGFGRFILRLIGGPDIRSQWDQEWILA